MASVSLLSSKSHICKRANNGSSTLVEGDKPAIATYRRPDADPNHEAARYIIAIIACARAKPLLQFQSAMIEHGLMLGMHLRYTKILGGIVNACGVNIVVIMVVAL